MISFVWDDILIDNFFFNLGIYICFLIYKYELLKIQYNFIFLLLIQIVNCNFKIEIFVINNCILFEEKVCIYEYNKKKIKIGINLLSIVNGGIYLSVEFINFENFKKLINCLIIICNRYEFD